MEIDPSFYHHSSYRESSSDEYREGSCRNDKNHEIINSVQNTKFLFHRREELVPKAPMKTKKIMNKQQRKKIFGSIPPESNGKLYSRDCIPLLPNENKENSSVDLSYAEDVRDDWDTRETSSSKMQLDQRDGPDEQEFILSERLKSTPKTRNYIPKNPSPSGLENDSFDTILNKNILPLTSHVLSMKNGEGHPANAISALPEPNMDLRQENHLVGHLPSPRRVQKELLNLLFNEDPKSSHQTLRTNISIQENATTAPVINLKLDDSVTKTRNTRKGGDTEPVSYNGSSGKDTKEDLVSYFTCVTKRFHQTILECCAPINTTQSPPTISHTNTFHRMMTEKYITKDHVTTSESVDDQYSL